MRWHKPGAVRIDWEMVICIAKPLDGMGGAASAIVSSPPSRYRAEQLRQEIDAISAQRLEFTKLDMEHPKPNRNHENFNSFASVAWRQGCLQRRARQLDHQPHAAALQEPERAGV